MYQHTRRSLLERRAELSPIFKKHGLSLNLGVLQDPTLTLVRPVARTRKHNERGIGKAVQRLDFVLDDLQRNLAVRQSQRR